MKTIIKIGIAAIVFLIIRNTIANRQQIKKTDKSYSSTKDEYVAVIHAETGEVKKMLFADALKLQQKNRKNENYLIYK